MRRLESILRKNKKLGVLDKLSESHPLLGGTAAVDDSLRGFVLQTQRKRRSARAGQGAGRLGDAEKIRGLAQKIAVLARIHDSRLEQLVIAVALRVHRLSARRRNEAVPVISPNVVYLEAAPAYFERLVRDR